MIRRSCLMLACSLLFIREYGITQESLAKGVSGRQWVFSASSHCSDSLTKARIRHAKVMKEHGTGRDSQTGELSYVAAIVCSDQSHHRGDGEDIIVQDVTLMAMFPKNMATPRSLSKCHSGLIP